MAPKPDERGRFQEEAERTIHCSALVVLPKAGHTMNIEEPAAFNGALESFFATVDAGGRWRLRGKRTMPDAALLGMF